MHAQALPAANRDRLKSAAGVAAIHAAIGYALITGFGVDVTRAPAEALKLFEVAPEPPPPPPPPVEKIVPPVKAARDPEGEAAPPGLKAQPSPLVAPPPILPRVVPPPVIAAPVPGTGSGRSAGNSDIAGSGTGAGGEGNGTGSGGRGDGSGGGGVATEARYLTGRIRDRDYPDVAGDAGVQGSVTVYFTVETDGRVTGCTVARSSGNRALDETTCRLIESRFRYEPARDKAGRPVADEMGWRQDYWIGRRKGSKAGAESAEAGAEERQ